MLYFFNYKWVTVETELKMNGNTADLYRMPLEGGGGTVYPDSICALRTAQHSTAQHSTAQITQSSSLFARRTVASEHHLPFSCELPSFALCASRSRALPQCKHPLALDSARNQFPYASPAVSTAPGGFFMLAFPDFELKST